MLSEGGLQDLAGKLGGGNSGGIGGMLGGLFGKHGGRVKIRIYGSYRQKPSKIR